MDDLWVSYVLDGLLGWDIRSLSNQVIPIDIGLFGLKTTYYKMLRNRIDIDTRTTLLKLSHNSSEHVREVATFLHLADDKQSMFEMLQTAFKWDVK